MLRKSKPLENVTHYLKLLDKYAEAKFKGQKPFEIRDISDRTFNIGDKVVYKVIDEAGNSVKHELNNFVFEIWYKYPGSKSLH